MRYGRVGPGSHRPRSLPLDTPHRHAPDDPFLRQQRQHQRREHGDHGAGA